MKKIKIIVISFIIILFIFILVWGVKEPLGSRFRYLYRGPVGKKYIYGIRNKNMTYALITKSYKGAVDIAEMINNEKDSLSYIAMGIGNFISCSTKKELRDTLRIDGVLFAIVQNREGSGRLAITEYLYVPEEFLYDDVVIECIE